MIDASPCKILPTPDAVGWRAFQCVWEISQLDARLLVGVPPLLHEIQHLEGQFEMSSQG